MLHSLMHNKIFQTIAIIQFFSYFRFKFGHNYFLMTLTLQESSKYPFVFAISASVRQGKKNGCILFHLIRLLESHSYQSVLNQFDFFFFFKHVEQWVQASKQKKTEASD